MCTKVIECSEQSSIDYDQVLNQVFYMAMDSSNTNTANLVNDETPRVKFLCSYGGSILPRPQDGKLRYVGGETRILSVPRDIDYEELMSRMRELYETAAILKYQQPDEDLDALVSVVNDDDVTNMMEEYDKLGSGDGITRLRIFLFSHPDQDASPHYMDGDDTERRYVDALNSLNESPDYRRQQLNDSPIATPVDEIHIADQLFNSMNLEGSGHNQRSYEMAMPQYNLRPLAIPSMGSGQHSAPIGPRHNEEAQWSPAYYSPRCGGPHDTRAFSEFPSTPSSAHYRVPFQEIPDKCMDRMPEEPNHQLVNSQNPFEHQQQYTDNVVWLPPGGVPMERGGFPGNILQGPNVVDAPSVCENCKMTFQRNQSSSDFQWKPEDLSHVELRTMRNGFPQVVNPCAGCLPNRQAVMVNRDSKLQHGMYNKEQGGSQPLYNDPQTSERGWILQNQLRMDESRPHISGVGRMGDYYTLNGAGKSIPAGPGNLLDGHLVPTIYAQDPQFVRVGAEMGGEVFHGQGMAASSHIHIQLEEQGVHAANSPYPYGADLPHQLLQGHPSPHAMWKNTPTLLQVPPLYDSSNLQPRNGMSNAVVPPGAVEGSPRFIPGVDQSPWVETSQRRSGVDGSALPDYPYSHFPKLSPGAPFQEIQQTFAQDPVRNLPNMMNIPPHPECLGSSALPSTILSDKFISSTARGYIPVQKEDTSNIAVRLDGKNENESTNSRKAECLDVGGTRPPKQNSDAENISAMESLNANDSTSVKPSEGSKDSFQKGESNTCAPAENADLSFLPELIASAKRAKLESAEVVKARAQEDGDAVISHDTYAGVANIDVTESPDADGNWEGGSENEKIDASKIESTSAEEEAIAKGLQTIKNADLEEIRELGSGTYGAVYHGKWKGSDVAIKRIKASCFSGRPSERQRLIADFWKEALILSSLHHPNVVSFYGIVRDGPDGSLATVTEFMVNGSLKQYLQKKDRTIDRRKRLIIAMDAAFGMEYLHGKNIVHFDLKCENLLVNMRDPHRPVCKIGDLGLSKVRQHTLVSGGVRGTLPWMAPELLSGKSDRVTEKIDVYSFGIVMWELLTGEEPYSGIRCASMIGGIVNNTLRPQIPTWCDPEWKSLMESCWASDPAERPSFSEISQRLRSMAAAMNVK